MTSSATPDATAASALPNAVTLARLAAAPVVGGLLLWAGATTFDAGRSGPALIYGAALAVFALAALSDWLDGAMARRMGATSPLGAALDHAADKALTSAALIALAATALPFDLVVAAAIIVVRDVAVAGLREGLSLGGRALPVDGLGKIKTVAALTAIGAAIAVQLVALTIPAGSGFSLIDALGLFTRAALWATATLAVWSGVGYLRAALR